MCVRLVRLVEWQMLLTLGQSQAMQMQLMDYIPESELDGQILTHCRWTRVLTLTNPESTTNFTPSTVILA